MRQNRYKAWIVCGIAALFYLYDYFIQVAPSVMTGSLVQRFHLNTIELATLFGCFYYSYAAMQIPGGILIDRFGARRLLCCASVLAILGTSLFARSETYNMLCIARLLSGTGVSIAYISALYLIAQWCRHDHFAWLAGWVQALGCLGAIVGQSELAHFINQFGFRQTTLIMVVVTLVLGLLIFIGIQDYGDDNTPKRMPHESMLQQILNCLKQPQLFPISWIGLLAWVPVAGIAATWGIRYLMLSLSISSLQASHCCSWFWIGLGIGSPLLGWLSQYWRRRRLPLLLAFSLGLLASLGLLEAAHLGFMITSACLFFLGFSAASQSLSFALLKDNITREKFATAASINNMAAILGGATAQQIVGWMLAQHHNAIISLAGFQQALWLLPISEIIAILSLFCFIKETYCQSQPPLTTANNPIQ